MLGLSSGLNSGAVKGIEKDSLWKETVVPMLEGRAPCEPFRVVLCYQGFGDNAKRDGVETERCLRLLLGNCTFLYFEFGRQDLEWIGTVISSTCPVVRRTWLGTSSRNMGGLWPKWAAS